jgi:hypothetical protein
VAFRSLIPMEGGKAGQVIVESRKSSGADGSGVVDATPRSHYYLRPSLKREGCFLTNRRGRKCSAEER